MLVLYDVNHNKIAPLPNAQNAKLERELSGEEVLSFSYPQTDSRYALIQEECYVRTDTNEYVVKEINEGGDYWTEFVCKINVEELKGSVFDSFEAIQQDAISAVNLALAGTGWSIGSCDVSKVRTLKKSHTNCLDILLEVQTAFSCEMSFDAVHKKVYIYQAMGTDKGAYFIDKLNLKKLDVQKTSYDFCTRLIPLGKDGLTIASVNGGLNYIENHQYSAKVITAYWEDNRYTDAQSLLNDAVLRLSVLSKPRRAYKADVIDLAGISAKYSILDYALGDTITLVDAAKNVRDKQRIVKTTEYLDEPEKNQVEIANRVLSLEDLQVHLSEAADTVQSITTTGGQVLGSKIDGIEYAKIKNVSIGTANIQDAAIVTAKIGDAQITTAKITDAAITSAKIGMAAVGTAQIANASITTALVANSAIGTSQIADASITDAKVVSLSASKLTAGTIDAGVITVTNLNATNITAGTLNGQRLADASITGAKIADQTIQTGNIAPGQITNTLIAASTITGDKIVAGSITGSHIAAATITANNMVAGTITAASGIIADAAIVTANIADAQITTAKIADAQITGAKIASATITAANIQDATITSAKIASIDASKITTGTLSAQRIVYAGSLLAYSYPNTGYTPTENYWATSVNFANSYNAVSATINLQTYAGLYKWDGTQLQNAGSVSGAVPAIVVASSYRLVNMTVYQIYFQNGSTGQWSWQAPNYTVNGYISAITLGGYTVDNSLISGNIFGFVIVRGGVY